MMRFNSYIFIKSLDDFHFSKAKRSFAKMAPLYGSFKNNRLVQELTEVLCTGYVLEILDREEYAKMLLAYFYDEFSSKDTVLRYLEWVLSNLKSTGLESKLQGRAASYFEYLTQSYSDLKSLYRSKTDLEDEEVLERAIDYVGVALKLCQASIDNKYEDEITEYPDAIEKDTVIYFTHNQFHLDRKGNLTAHDMNDEWKWFYYMLTWQIYCRICQDDAQEEC